MGPFVSTSLAIMREWRGRQRLLVYIVDFTDSPEAVLASPGCFARLLTVCDKDHIPSYLLGTFICLFLF